MVRLAYQSRAPQIIDNCFDLPSIIGNCYDDVTEGLYTNSKMPQNITDLYVQYYKLVKKPVCAGTLKLIDGYLATGKWPDTSEQIMLRGRELGIDYDELINRSLLRDTKVVKIGSLQASDGSYILPVTVSDKYTNTDFVLQLLLNQDDNGIYRVTKIVNYHNYLLHVNTLCQEDLDRYIHATGTVIKEYNDRFTKLQIQFKTLADRLAPDAAPQERLELAAFIDGKVVPIYKQRLVYLQSLNVPVGAKHLHALRLKSNELTIEAWHEYAQGIAQNDQTKISAAENIHKQAMEIEQKVKDILLKMPALFMPDTP